jgi:hypothetical protein
MRTKENQYVKDARGMILAHNLNIPANERNIMLLASAMKAADQGDMLASQKLIDILLAR